MVGKVIRCRILFREAGQGLLACGKIPKRLPYGRTVVSKPCCYPDPKWPAALSGQLCDGSVTVWQPHQKKLLPVDIALWYNMGNERGHVHKLKTGTTVPAPCLAASGQQTAGREPANKFNLGSCVSLAQGLCLYQKVIRMFD